MVPGRLTTLQKSRCFTPEFNLPHLQLGIANKRSKFFFSMDVFSVFFRALRMRVNQQDVNFLGS